MFLQDQMLQYEVCSLHLKDVFIRLQATSEQVLLTSTLYPSFYSLLPPKLLFPLVCFRFYPLLRIPKASIQCGTLEDAHIFRYQEGKFDFVHSRFALKGNEWPQN